MGLGNGAATGFAGGAALTGAATGAITGASAATGLGGGAIGSKICVKGAEVMGIATSGDMAERMASVVAMGLAVVDMVELASKAGGSSFMVT